MLVCGARHLGLRGMVQEPFLRKSGRTASEQLAANKDQEKKLSLQLQAVLPPRTSLKDACAGFKTLNDCVAALHVSHNLNLKFNCLKWDVTGAKPLGDVKSCPAPSNGKAVD